MAEIATSIIANTAGNLATEYASPYVKYFFHFGKIVEDFKHRRNELESKKDQMRNEVDKATRQTEVIEKDVQDWLTKAEDELREARNLEDEVEHSKCFKWCPNWGWRYCLSKKVAKKTFLISKLLKSSNFPQVGRCAPLQGIEFLTSDNFMPSESSKAASDDIIKALTSDDVDIIGLHGMPGVGKTTLAKEVGKQAKEQKLFDEVIMVTVSQDQDINKIQDKIAEILGFEFKTKEVKAEELWRRLKSEKKVLIIVDDVWDRLELEHVGIPVGDGCKILLTTRLQNVCAQMNCKKKIQLNILSEDDAWTLFKYYASLEKASSTLTDVAKEVAKECKGLPLAIRTIGTTLKDETLDEWEAVNQRLKDSRHLENQDVCEDIYMRLKISYDKLKGNNSRLCLLLCSLFPEDYEIRIEELTVYGIGQGMFDDVDSIEDAKREMRVITKTLQKSGLLLETGTVGTVKMHDVVRDFVHWMTSEGENMFLVKSDLNEWPRGESLGCYTVISLINSKINNFPDRLEFPKLKVFLVDSCLVHFERRTFFFYAEGKPHALTRVPSMFLQGLKALKVLFLRNVLLSLEDLQFLPNLRTLRLESCVLENALSSLRNLKKLEILIIAYFEIKDPAWHELMGLTTLRLLAISCNFSSEVFIPPKYLLSSLVQLEELHLGLHSKWAISEKSANKASMSELHLLPRLTQLSLQVRSECIPKKFLFPPLQRYDIAVNDKLLSRSHWHGSPRRLTITKFSLDAFKELFCNVEELSLKHIMDLEYLIEVASIQNLKKLTVEECGQLQVIFQTDGVLPCANEEIQTPLLSSLTNLQLVSLPELRSIWKEPTHLGSLRNLKVVMISSCKKLTSVFSLSLAQTLVHLERLKVSNCNGLEKVFNCEMINLENITAESFVQLQGEENQEMLPLSTLKELNLELLPELKCIWEGQSHHVNLQSLKVMRINGCGKLASIFSPSLAQTLLHLEQLQIRFCRELEHIISTETGRDDHGMVSNRRLHPLICWPKLRILRIRCCEKLEYVFPITLAQGLQHLELIDIANSPQLKQIFSNITEERDNGQDIQLLGLQFLVLEDLQNLSSLCPRNYFVMSPSLKSFEVRSCPKLTDFTIHLEVAQQAQSKGFQLYAFKEMICCSKNLTLDRTSGCRNLFSIVDQEGLNGLTFLQLHNLSNVECLHDTTDHRQPTNAFSNLVELVIEEMIGLKKLCNNRPPKGILQKLEKLKITNCMNLASLSPVGQNLTEVLIKACGQLREIFQVDEVLHNREANQAPLMSNLTRLELELLSDLRCIWKGSSHSVINLRSLKIVRISNCNRLRCLFSPALVKSLVQLEQLFLHDLPELEQLITELESDVEQEQQVSTIVKEKVDEQHKPFLPLMLPSLKKFGVSKCPQLTPFVIQQEVNNYAQVKGLYLSNQQCNSFDILLRQSLPNLEHRTVGNHLRFLKWLIMSNCSKLKYLFSPMLAQSLPHLSYLYIQQCKEMEQIVDKDKTSASSSQGHLEPICFPSLIRICIEECINLTSVFSISVTLSQLQWFTIRGASKLEQVFEYQGGIDIDDTEKEIVLPQLRGLSLEELPRLKSFIPMGYDCSFPHLFSLKVEECSNLTTSFSTDSKFTIHARTKAAGDAPMEGSATDVDVMEVSDTNGETAWPVGSDINWIRSRWRGEYWNMETDCPSE